jgi:hypothetical protein
MGRSKLFVHFCACCCILPLVNVCRASVVLIGPNQADWIHVGDSTPTGWPDSVGSTWTRTFSLTAIEALQPSKLDFYQIEADPNLDTVSINGVLLGRLTFSNGVLDRDPQIHANWVFQSLSVAAGTLVSGANSIAVEAGVSFPGSGFPLDDFMLKDMRVAAIPEPSSLLFAMGICLVLSRCKNRRCPTRARPVVCKGSNS